MRMSNSAGRPSSVGLAGRRDEQSTPSSDNQHASYHVFLVCSFDRACFEQKVVRFIPPCISLHSRQSPSWRIFFSSNASPHALAGRFVLRCSPINSPARVPTDFSKNNRQPNGRRTVAHRLIPESTQATQCSSLSSFETRPGHHHRHLARVATLPTTDRNEGIAALCKLVGEVSAPASKVAGHVSVIGIGGVEVPVLGVG